MKRSIHLFSTAILAAALLILAEPKVTAGRIGGPMSTVATAPGGQSVFFTVSFAAGEPAIVTVVGNGRSVLNLMIYDTDGHVAIGAGGNDRKTARMDVYRAGVFRVEVRNISIYDDTFTLMTN
jgi:hypothetical protein